MKPTAFAIWLALAGVLVLTGIVLTAIALFQDRLLYYPARATVEEMATRGMRAWPSAQDFRGLVAEPAGPARATALVFHGNAGHAGDRAHFASTLTPLGLRVILAEYPGYGPRDGALGERSLVADAERTIALAHKIHGTPLLLIGESLGAGVAAAAAARQRDRIAGLMLVTPWDRLEHVAAHHYPWLPVRWMLRDHYDSATHLAAFGGPELVAVAARDSIVPARFGEALYAALSEPKRLAVIEGAGHNDWLGHVDPAWWRDATAFVLGEGGPR